MKHKAKNELTKRLRETGDAPQKEFLALYHFVGCPFCSIANATISRLDIDVELRDIHQESEFRKELVDARGRGTVPVLRITSPDGKEQWLPESKDIVEYLERNYGK